MKLPAAVDAEQARRLAPDLPAENQARVELDAKVLQRRRVAPVDFAQRLADAAAPLEIFGAVSRLGRSHRGDSDAAPRSRLVTACVIARLPALCSTSTRSPRLLEHRGLAEGADLIDTGVGAGVGQEHQARVQQHGHAIGH